MVAVGDSNEVFLFNKRGRDFEKIATLIATNDASFSCDWNQVSDMFAVGSQDGYVSLWDIRSTHKMATLETYQHTTFVNIVDTRALDQRQLVQVSPEGQDVQITGLRFSPDCSSLFVGLDEPRPIEPWFRPAHSGSAPPAARPACPAIHTQDNQAEAALHSGNNNQDAMPANMPAASYDAATPPLDIPAETEPRKA
ncbi:hypothetical protein EV182_002255 [Spiromyces aspiralis]|uniref:Uncharacterized protein n=1 Tax=Spiromyces aspiralis TaxID=68401 RepID=A0ACC1HSB8_9FUNG|nr:hypothetical protein EV182_002255 [Spiromyces aspiralis]